jgi:Predicted EndoIII-related endonuclease
MGAVLADSVLQAGLSYAKVVKPRIASILKAFPHATTMNILIGVIEREGTPKFLQWEHREKVSRFDNLVAFMAEAEVNCTSELSRALRDKSFRNDIRHVRGVGPKTVDYLACLVGVDCIAVDRHIRRFAELAGLEDDSYDYLNEVFSFAADLLSISRREFDASIWRYQSEQSVRQLSLEFMQ